MGIICQIVRKDMFVYTVNFQFRKGGSSMRYEKHRNTLTVFLEGELDHCCAQSIRREMDRLLDDLKVQRLVIDMGEMNFMDSSGIGVILGRYRILSSRGGSVAVRGMNRQVARVFQLSGMGQIIEVMKG